MVHPAPSGDGGEASLADDCLVAADGTVLPLRSWRPSAGAPWAVAVGLHGFNDHSLAFSEIGTELAERGIATYAYDQRGFGRAPGFRYWHGTAKMVSDYRDAVALARARHPGLPVFAVGESMGGAVVLAARGGGADGAVLIAPAVWGFSTMPLYQSAPLGLLSHLVPWWRVSGAGLPIRPSDNRDALRRLSADPRVIKETRMDAIYGLVTLMDEALAASAELAGPALVLYGKADDIVPKAPTCRMIRRLPAPPAGRWRVVLYPEGHHLLTRDLAGRQAIDDIAAFIAGPDRAVPSGAEVDRAEAGRPPALRAGALCGRFAADKDP